MTLSNALPIQFWLSSEQSFNLKVVDGITPRCWCQPWNSGTIIPFQFTEEEDYDYLLNVVDENGEVLESISFEQNELYSDNYLSSYPLVDFTNSPGPGANWTPGVNPFVITTGIGTSSDFLIETITGIPSGRYILNYGINFSGSGVVLAVSFLKAGVTVGSTFLTVEGTNESKQINLSDAPDTIRLGVISVTPSSRTTTITALGLVRNGYYYALSFDPSSYVNSQIGFEIINQSASPPQMEAYSDCVLVKTSHFCHKEITYYNNSNFAGLIYESVSPAVTFTSLIPAVFFEEETPAEQEDTELSNGEIVRLYNKLELKKRLDIGFVPLYMHQKIQLILMHDNVYIDGKRWLRRDAYEKIEGNKRFPLRRASVWLHDKDFIKENQL